MTLLETALYIGLIAITLPFMSSFLIQTQAEQQMLGARTRMEQSASLVMHEMTYALTKADGISTSTSTLNSDASVFRFHDDTGTTITIDRPTVIVNFTSGTQNVRRLRYQRGADPAVYLTDDNIDVTEWRVVAIRDSANVLTGVRISLDLAMLASNGSPFRNSSFSGDTTVSLQGHTVEN